MRIKSYEEFVVGVMSPDSMATDKDKLNTMGLGLAGEAGEVAELVKKLNFHGMEFDDVAKQKIIKELGDVLFYATFAAKVVCGMTVKEIMKINMDKLLARHKDGKFDKEAAKAKELAKTE